MTEVRHLQNAPIKEALIDIQVALPEKGSMEALLSLYESFKDDYPDMKALHRGEFGFQLNGGESAQTTMGHSVIGYRFASSDGTQVVQFRNDGFTFSRLEPYQDWEQMRDEAIKLWEIYINSASPMLITRVATRFINVFTLPYGSDLNSYLKAPPVIPEGLNNEVGGFFTRIEIHEPTIGARGLITQTLEKSPEDQASIVLDIDVFKLGRYEIGEKGYLECLENLHDYKNDIFFKSLTDTAMELF